MGACELAKGLLDLVGRRRAWNAQRLVVIRSRRHTALHLLYQPDGFRWRPAWRSESAPVRTRPTRPLSSRTQNLHANPTHHRKPDFFVVKPKAGSLLALPAHGRLLLLFRVFLRFLPFGTAGGDGYHCRPENFRSHLVTSLVYLGHRLVGHAGIVHRGHRLRLQRVERFAGRSITSTPSFFSTSTSFACTAFTPSNRPPSPFFVA